MSEGKILTEKPCSKCKKVFPNTEEHFYKRSKTSKSRTDPLRIMCKQCHYEDTLASRKDACHFCKTSLSGAQRRKYCSLRCKTLDKMGGIGAKYGRYTILDFAGPRNGDTYVLCQCDCGTVREVWIHPLKKGLSRSCGCLHRDEMSSRKAEAHPNWKGGRHKNKYGYVLIHRPDHPNAHARGYIFEHVYVMSEFLGRPLRDNENVHHKSGKKDQNDLDNLELWTMHQPHGQRAEDVFAWCKSYIKTYEADIKKLQRINDPADPRQLVFLD